jgi:hypothetical protein
MPYLAGGAAAFNTLFENELRGKCPREENAQSDTIGHFRTSVRRRDFLRKSERATCHSHSARVGALTVAQFAMDAPRRKRLSLRPRATNLDYSRRVATRSRTSLVGLASRLSGWNHHVAWRSSQLATEVPPRQRLTRGRRITSGSSIHKWARWRQDIETHTTARAAPQGRQTLA